jgi:hypothetical protein
MSGSAKCGLAKQSIVKLDIDLKASHGWFRSLTSTPARSSQRWIAIIYPGGANGPE